MDLIVLDKPLELSYWTAEVDSCVISSFDPAFKHSGIQLINNMNFEFIFKCNQVVLDDFECA